MSASRTAIATLIARALHQQMDGEPRYDDPVAGRLYAGVMLAKAAGEESDPDDRRALRDHVSSRTVHAEGALREAVAERGVKQYVVLGAGYDTFAYRLPAWARDLRIFEVDRPETQAAKRAALRFSGIAIPERLVFAGIDFERETLRACLSQAGADLTRPLFYSWLGVTVYLTRAAIEATLREVAAGAPGSEIAFTFGRATGGERWAARAAASGEPWLTRFEEADLAQLVRLAGFDHCAIDGSSALARTGP